MVTFVNMSYSVHSYNPVKLSSDFSKIDQDHNLKLCEGCLEYVKLYSEIHHTGWRLFNLAKDKVSFIQDSCHPKLPYAFTDRFLISLTTG